MIQNQIHYSENNHQSTALTERNNSQKADDYQDLIDLHKQANYNYWSLEEQTVYLKFLVQNVAEISGNESRRKLRMFKKISTLLGTRTPKQVKSHHQKLEEKFKSIQKIIVRLSKSIKLKTEDGQQLEASSYRQENQLPFFEIKDNQPIQQIFLPQTPFYQNHLQSFIKFTYDDLQYSPDFG